MRILNNKGFTLIEVLAVVALLAVLGLIAVPNILKTINNSKENTYKVMVGDIKVAGQALYEELEFVGGNLSWYDNTGKTGAFLTIEDTADGKRVVTNLQSLVSNGFLTGTNNSDKSVNKNTKVILNSKTSKDIGECSIIVTRSNTGSEISYSITENSNAIHGGDCPSNDDYNK